MTAPSRDEFEIWRAHPVTQFVFAGLRKLAETQEAAFKDFAWIVSDGQHGWDELRITRAGCSAKVECWSDLAGLTVEDAYGANGLEPPPPEAEEAA